MSETKLNEALQELKTEIAALQVEDTDAKRRLETLVEGLEKKLETPSDEEHHHGLVEDVRDSVEHFEVEYPRLTAILNDIMMALSNMGI